MSQGMNFTLKVWRQKSALDRGKMVSYRAADISPDMSFLEMLDLVNEGLERGRKDPIAFDSDCREGICGACGLVINGVAHGPGKGTTTCQVYMRSFRDGDVIYVEPWGLRLREYGLGPGWQLPPHPSRHGRGGDGCRRLHRLWGLRGLL